LVFVGNGDFFGAAVDFEGVLAAACGMAVLGAMVAALRVGWLELGVTERPEGAVGHPGGHPRGHPGEQTSAAAPGLHSRAREGEQARRAFTAFWAGAGVLISLSYVLSSTPQALNSDRYLVGVLYAIVALAMLLVEHRPRLRGVVVAGVLVYCIGGTLAAAHETTTKNPSHLPEGRIAGGVQAIAAREHLTYGYAGYWDAAPITWATHLHVQVYPVSTCPAGICRFFLHTIAGWYRPHTGQRSFLLVDPAQIYMQALPPGLGPPSAIYGVGRVTMYVYPYDIASHIAAP
jgi:hypothetical protein